MWCDCFGCALDRHILIILDSILFVWIGGLPPDDRAIEGENSGERKDKKISGVGGRELIYR